MSHSASNPSDRPRSPRSNTDPSHEKGREEGGDPHEARGETRAERGERSGLFDRLRGLLGGWRSSGSLRSELAEVLSSDEDFAADLTVTERSMLKNILELRELRVGDVMVPRADIVAVQKEISLGELLAVFAKAGHSRLVVFDDTLDDPVGMVHIRDLVAHLTQRALIGRPALQAEDVPARDALATGIEAPANPTFNPKALDLSTALSASKLIRRLLFVPPSMPSIELLASMQASRIHLALVIDEYGGTDGIVSMEDLVEEIVGDIEDEHDEDDVPLIARQSDGTFIADARANLEDVAELVDPAFALGEEAEEVDTLGGLLVTLAGRVPVRGEIVAAPGGFEIEVLDADPRRVKRLRIMPARTGGAPMRRADDAAEGGARRNGLPSPSVQANGERSAKAPDPDAA
ncbi:hemolysin family protein [Ancylobacter sp. 6x-1]|uniref:Hemolysin family protein n=1 Tax=Ancylobacter crimeensis TaxID=2579147 RepID=A0ABT0DDS7_9HYPH|nr:hemolysin family protein [Ancylobacter crimeensis]MCK0198019.1 hemolysin family protein [Ancylobacter crimeensis]